MTDFPLPDPNRYETVSFHQRALKYLLAQLQNTEIADAENAATAGQGDDIAQDDGDEEWEEEDDLTKNEKDEMAWLSGKDKRASKSDPSLILGLCCRYAWRWWRSMGRSGE